MQRRQRDWSELWLRWKSAEGVLGQCRWQLRWAECNWYPGRRARADVADVEREEDRDDGDAEAGHET